MQVYKIAGCVLLINQSLPELAPFAINSGQISEPLRSLSEKPDDDNIPTCSVRGLVGGIECLVRLYINEQGYLIDIDNAGCFAITKDGSQIIYLDEGENRFKSLPVTMALLGPVLALALALHGVFYLHASAFQVGGSAVALTGVSGAGKSTLAAYLHEQGWRSLSDDILPITRSGGAVVALPHYPQLRLGTNQYTGVGAPERLPLLAIYVLDVPENSSIPRIELVTPREVMRTLLFESVGVSIFPQDLIKAHMDFCSEVQKRVPVKRLIYPHHMAILPIVRSLLEADIVSG